MSELFVILYFVLLGALSLHGVHILWLIAHRARSPRIPTPPPASIDSPNLRKVTIQIPFFNERTVVERSIRAACAIDYPREKLEIQILDDSTDETCEIAEQLADCQRSQGFDIRVLHREVRRDFKAGALDEGLRVAKGELIAVFDADFVPNPDFLLRAVPCFEDPAVGMTQVRWGHLNENASLLTRLQALFLDGHFVMESETRDRAGLFLTFNGTAGVWRRECIEDAGGWEGDTLTEDLDLSYRAQLIGWRFRFLVDVEAPAELPESVEAFKTQQARWTRGAVETLRKLGPDIVYGNLPLKVKIEGLFHLTSHLVFPALVMLSVLAYPALAIRLEDSWWKLLAIDLPLYALGIFSVNLFYVWGQFSLHPNDPWRILRIPGLLFLGTGLAISNTLAVLEGYFGRAAGVFHRTPKIGDRKRKTYPSLRSGSAWIETALAVYLFVCIGAAANRGLWAAIPFLSVFALGYGGVGVRSLYERFAEHSQGEGWNYTTASGQNSGV